MESRIAAKYLVDNTVGSAFLTDADATTGVRVGASTHALTNVHKYERTLMKT